MSRGRVLVADDHVRTRAEVRRALEESGRFEVCADVADAPTAVEAARRERPDICLLDIKMPGNGIAATAQIKAELPDTAIVMLTVSRADNDLFDALRAGAKGYLLKGINEDELADALERVLSGQASLPGTLVARLIDEFRDRERFRVNLPEERSVLLTAREWDVLELMRTGASTLEIAERLFISATTVRSHVSAILRKLEVSDRSSAISMIDADRSSGRSSPAMM
jgi:DNA-binding NarL/FixJ family response regulator